MKSPRCPSGRFCPGEPTDAGSLHPGAQVAMFVRHGCWPTVESVEVGQWPHRVHLTHPHTGRFITEVIELCDTCAIRTADEVMSARIEREGSVQESLFEVER